MATNKIQTGIRFEPELLSKIAFVAKKNKRSPGRKKKSIDKKCEKGIMDMIRSGLVISN